MDTIRLLTIGVSAHQKLELLSGLLKLLGYESLAVFGDCFDEVSRGVYGRQGSAKRSHYIIQPAVLAALCVVAQGPGMHGLIYADVLMCSCLMLAYLMQVTLLDPVRFPGAIKVFAREVGGYYKAAGFDA